MVTINTVNKMLAAMKKSLEEKHELIALYKKDSPSAEEAKGEYSGLYEVFINFFGKTARVYDNDFLDITPFAKYNVILNEKISEEKPVRDNPSFNTGYFRGLEQGRSFIDALLLTEIQTKPLSPRPISKGADHEPE